MPNPRNQTVRGSHALNPSFTGTAPQPTTFGVTAASPATLAQLASSPTPGSLLSDAPASTPKSIPTRYGTTPTNNPVPAAPTTFQSRSNAS